MKFIPKFLSIYSNLKTLEGLNINVSKKKVDNMLFKHYVFSLLYGKEEDWVENNLGQVIIDFKGTFDGTAFKSRKVLTSFH